MAASCWHKYRIPLCGGLALALSFTASAREFYFSPSSLEGGPGSDKDVDLALFSQQDAQLPGTYHSTILINNQKVDELDVAYISDNQDKLQPQLTTALLRKWGIQVDNYPLLAAVPTTQALTKSLGDYIPSASAELDFSKMVLKLSLPQAAINSLVRGYIDPSRWDDGVPVAFTDYSVSGLQHSGNDQNSDSQYLNLRSGLNINGWRLRNYSTWSNNDGEHSWQTINSWLEHDIDALRAQFIAGESSTRADVFDSVQYKGVSLASDDSMLPYSQRGFAPVIRGIAHSNAQVSVRQNGYLIYQINVAPGAFEINDLYSSTNSGDLEVTVTEADGSETHFTQPYSSLAVMQRPGQARYEVTAGQLRPDSGLDGDTPLFTQSTLIYGINNRLTAFGGTIIADNYLAGNVGIGTTLGVIGALSADMTWARSHPDQSDTSTGQSLRLLYSGKIDSTDTSFTLAGYRYSTSGYYSFADANQRYDDSDWASLYNKRNRLQLSINQSVMGSSLYLNGYQQDYWGSGNKERSLSAGLSRSFSRFSVHMAYTYSKTSDSSSDRMISFGFSLPLSQWLPKSWASYNLSHSQHGETSQSIALNGTLLDDDRLGYSLQQSTDNRGNADNTSLYGSYRSSVSNLSAGYYYASDGSQQVSYGASGGLVIHPQGVTLSQPLGDQFAIINAEGASGIRFQNRRGIATDSFGNAIIPSLTAYQENMLRIDTTSLPQDVDTQDTAVTLIPSHGAAVSTRINAHVGYRVLATLTRQNGKKVPFGAIGGVDGSAQSGIVDDSGTLYLAGIGEKARLTVRWGSQPDQQCFATLQPSSAADNPAGIRKQSVQCLQE